MAQTPEHDTNVAELRARIDGITEATGALATRIERLDEMAAYTPQELRLALRQLIDLIYTAHGCVGDAVAYIEERLRAAKES